MVEMGSLTLAERRAQELDIRQHDNSRMLMVSKRAFPRGIWRSRRHLPNWSARPFGATKSTGCDIAIPRNREGCSDIAQIMREVAKAGMLLLVDSDQIPSNERTEAFPTHKVPQAKS